MLKKLRRLPWAESEPYLLATLLRASHKGRYSQIPHIASLAAGLSRYHPTLGVRLVDAVLEGTVAGLEAPEAGGHFGRDAGARVGRIWARGVWAEQGRPRGPGRRGSCG